MGNFCSKNSFQSKGCVRIFLPDSLAGILMSKPGCGGTEPHQRRCVLWAEGGSPVLGLAGEGQLGKKMAQGTDVSTTQPSKKRLPAWVEVLKCLSVFPCLQTRASCSWRHFPGPITGWTCAASEPDVPLCHWILCSTLGQETWLPTLFLQFMLHVFLPSSSKGSGVGTCAMCLQAHTGNVTHQQTRPGETVPVTAWSQPASSHSSERQLAMSKGQRIKSAVYNGDTIKQR